MIVVVMGVSGTGKTTVGRLLATSLQLPFLDADDFHTVAALDQMGRGEPLTDEQRLPWLDRLHHELEREAVLPFHGAVLACSALTERYRRRLAGDLDVRWVWLDGDPELIRQRMEDREGGVPAALLDSQFALLEPPAEAITLDVAAAPEQLMHQALDALTAATEPATD